MKIAIVMLVLLAGCAETVDTSTLQLPPPVPPADPVSPNYHPLESAPSTPNKDPTVEDCIAMAKRGRSHADAARSSPGYVVDHPEYGVPTDPEGVVRARDAPTLMERTNENAREQEDVGRHLMNSQIQVQPQRAVAEQQRQREAEQERQRAVAEQQRQREAEQERQQKREANQERERQKEAERERERQRNKN